MSGSFVRRGGHQSLDRRSEEPDDHDEQSNAQDIEEGDGDRVGQIVAFILDQGRFVGAEDTCGEKGSVRRR